MFAKSLRMISSFWLQNIHHSVMHHHDSVDPSSKSRTRGATIHLHSSSGGFHCSALANPLFVRRVLG